MSLLEKILGQDMRTHGRATGAPAAGLGPIIIKSMACCFGVVASGIVGVTVAGIFSSGRSSYAPVALFVPLFVGIFGFSIQRMTRWGPRVAVWTLVFLALLIYIATAIFGQYWPDEFLSVSLLGNVGQIFATVGTPWIAGSLIGWSLRRG